MEMIIFLTMVVGWGLCIGEFTPIHQSVETSYSQCKEVCAAWTECRSAKYLTAYQLCQFYDVNVQQCSNDNGVCHREPGAKFYVKTDEELHQDSEAKPPEVCEPPMQHANADILGNMRTFGSKIKYVCKNNDTLSAISECQNNGKWTDVDLSCFCEKPQFELQGNVKTSEVTKIEKGLYKVNLTCDDGKTIRPNDSMECSVKEGKWKHQDFVCCRPMKFSETSRRVYLLSKDTNISDTIHWMPDPNDETDIFNSLNGIIGKRCYYVYDNFWDILSSEKINTTAFRVRFKEKEKSFLQFTWMSKAKTWLLENTKINKSDQMTGYDSMEDLVKIKQDNETGFLEIIVASNASSYSSVCDVKTGWLIVTNHVLPCVDGKEVKTDVPYILYSELNSETFLNMTDQNAIFFTLNVFFDK